MKIFLAGENGKKHIIRKLANVNIFSGGESRHWLQAPLIEDKNETIPSKPTHDTEIPRRATNGDYPIRGGYV